MEWIVMYKYFVSYWAIADNNHTGYGRIEYNTDRPITSQERLSEIEQDIIKINPDLGIKQVIILNWRRFEEL